MRKAFASLVWLSISVIFLSCGTPTPTSGQRSGLKYRALISNSVSAGTSAPGVYLIDAQKDVRPVLSPIAAGNTPGLMYVTPNKGLTLVFSGTSNLGSDNQLTFVNNATESASGHITLPGVTESIVISPDSTVSYAAVPLGPIVGASPGVVDFVSLNSGALLGEVSVPAVRYLSLNNSGNRIFGFSDDSDSIAVITPSNVANGNAVTYLSGFDRPVWAYFSSDDLTAFVVNCGAECGGTQASVQKVDLSGTQCLPTGVCAPVPVPAATEALVDNSTMYLAGTPVPAAPCPSGTQATSCGLVTIFDLSSMTITNSAPILITDGYHKRIALGANGQLFIGARSCTEIIPAIPPPAGAETRGCLSIYNTQTGAVVVPPANGDVTGLQPIATRTVVYVVQGGSLSIYDTATDALGKTQIINVVGQFIDVKTIDF